MEPDANPDRLAVHIETISRDLLAHQEQDRRSFERIEERFDQMNEKLDDMNRSVIRLEVIQDVVKEVKDLVKNGHSTSVGHTQNNQVSPPNIPWYVYAVILVGGTLYAILKLLGVAP